jgi:PadR family transcriptional regulator AphA
MSLEYILLGLLREPASGFDLKKVFDDRIGYFWSAELSQIYPTLGRLEKRGWLRSRDAAAKRGRGRRVWEVTPSGRRALTHWLAGEPAIGDERFAYLAQVYLMDELNDLGKTLRFFLRLRDHFAQKLESLRRLERSWKEADSRYPDALPLPDFHVQLTLRKGLSALNAHVEWCDECIARLRTRSANQTSRPVRTSGDPGKSSFQRPGAGDARKKRDKTAGTRH